MDRTVLRNQNRAFSRSTGAPRPSRYISPIRGGLEVILVGGDLVELECLA